MMEWLIDRLREHSIATRPPDDVAKALFEMAYNAGAIDARGFTERLTKGPFSTTIGPAPPKPKGPFSTFRMSAITEYFESVAYDAVSSKLAAIESVLQQWVASGHAIESLAYEHLPDENLERLAFGKVVLLEIRQRSFTTDGTAHVVEHGVIRMVDEFMIYPNGRPGGYPRLYLTEAEPAAEAETPADPPEADGNR